MPGVFLSYVRANSLEVQRLAADLRAYGIKVWIDKEQIKPGYRWEDSIRRAIAAGDFFIACFSREYTERSSTYMNEELVLAIEELRKRPTDRAWFIPVLLNDTVIPARSIGGGETLTSIQWVDLSRDWQAGVRQIVSVIRPDALDRPAFFMPKLNEGEWTLLVKLISRNRCLPILGPGVRWPHPSDRTLLVELAREFGYSGDEGDLDQLVEHVTLSCGDAYGGVARRVPESIAMDASSQHDEPHNILAELPFEVYVTTNADLLLEQALHARGKAARTICLGRHAAAARDDVESRDPEHCSVHEPAVFHLLGAASDPPSLVLSDFDYTALQSYLSQDTDDYTLMRTLYGSSQLWIGMPQADVKLRQIARAVSGGGEHPVRRVAFGIDAPTGELMSLADFMKDLWARWTSEGR